MDVVATDFKGFWQEQGWSDIATIKTMSRIDFPRNYDLLPTGPAKVGGIAFAGARGTAKVEVSADGGKTWQEAQIRRPLGPYTWVLWTATVDLTEGEHQMMVRATDGTGKTQTDRPSSPLPDGASGWAAIRVRVAPGAPAPVVNIDQSRQQPFSCSVMRRNVGYRSPLAMVRMARGLCCGGGWTSPGPSPARGGVTR